MRPQFLIWCLTFGAHYKNDGHYFCRAGGNRPDGLNEPVTIKTRIWSFLITPFSSFQPSQDPQVRRDGCRTPDTAGWR
ncbi:hypothetical protein E1K64_24320 [Salmonella enterica subsp. enterica serovar Poona]|nr:hypothetical protein [Salmonella enterica subsp. enterica serovar Poona]